MKVIIFEDQPEKLSPLTHLFPQYDLRIGRRSVLENTATFFPRLSIEPRARSYFNIKKHPVRGPVLYLSGRFFMTRKVSMPKEDGALQNNGSIVGFIKYRPPFPDTCQDISATAQLQKRAYAIQGYFLDEIWDLVKYHEDILNFELKTRTSTPTPKHVYVIGNRQSVQICKGAKVHRFVTIDVSDGPVYIDRSAVIRPFTTIIGPAYIGPNCVVERAKVTKCTLGPNCRVGGEIEATIFQGYVNKYHEGFIGHSVIGKWVNFGALTSNSDLKNNYSTVRVMNDDEERDSGMVKLGCFIGDHTKTGIGTLIPTGARIGCFVNFFGGGMMPRTVENFTWLTAEKHTRYHLKKALDTAQHIMARRQVTMSPAYKQVVKTVYSWQNSL